MGNKRKLFKVWQASKWRGGVGAQEHVLLWMLGNDVKDRRSCGT